MASNTFFWDLGFDFNAIQDVNTLSYLQNGLLTNSVSAFPRTINKGDTVVFNAFNLTSGASTTDGTMIIAAAFNFTNALVTQTASSPFASEIVITTGGPTGAVASIALHPNAAVPFWTLTTQQIANPGSFLFSVALVVQGTGTNNVRTFVVDPEMIVGGTN